MLTFLKNPARILVVALFLAVCPAYSQQANSGLIGSIPAGNYVLEQPSVSLTQPADAGSRPILTYFWKQTEESGKPVRIGDGTVSYIRDGEERSARFELKSGEFWMHFESPEGKKSYTVYQYEKVPGGFRISREDPYIRESYTFKLK